MFRIWREWCVCSSADAPRFRRGRGRRAGGTEWRQRLPASRSGSGFDAQNTSFDRKRSSDEASSLSPRGRRQDQERWYDRDRSGGTSQYQGQAYDRSQAGSRNATGIDDRWSSGDQDEASNSWLYETASLAEPYTDAGLDEVASRSGWCALSNALMSPSCRLRRQGGLPESSGPHKHQGYMQYMHAFRFKPQDHGKWTEQQDAWASEQPRQPQTPQSSSSQQRGPSRSRGPDDGEERQARGLRKRENYRSDNSKQHQRSPGHQRPARDNASG